MFRAAVRRLTLLYTLVQLALFAGFAVGVYLFVTGTFDFDSVSSDGAAAIGAVERGFSQLRVGLVVAFACVCIVAPIIGYAMARVALGPLRTNYERQQRFVDDASHELRSPLSIIRGELELALSSERSAAEYRQAITTTLDAAQSLIQLSDDLLLLATDSAQDVRGNFVVVSIADVIGTAIRLQAEAARKRMVIRAGPDSLILGSSSLLVRAVANIIDNSAKYGRADGDITITSTESSGKATISVRDTGLGMSSEMLGHARDRFWRDASTGDVPGHGLGLALVEQIIKLHRGRMVIESAAGQGSTVSLIIPTAPATPNTQRP